MRRLGILAVAFSIFVRCSFAAQKEKPKAKSPPPSQSGRLTKEQREILKFRTILENLELLRNFEKIQYLNFLSARQNGRKESKPKAKDKKDGNKGGN